MAMKAAMLFCVYIVIDYAVYYLRVNIIGITHTIAMKYSLYYIYNTWVII